MSATDRYSHQLLYATVRQRLLDDIAQGVYQAGQQILPKTSFVHNITSAALPFAKPSAT
ncbi:DNA-binding transcriptional regulator FrlR [Escherichia coli]|nr:DNA-binding transcriptional regulator FrlR [Escherichia coli]